MYCWTKILRAVRYELPRFFKCIAHEIHEYHEKFFFVFFVNFLGNWKTNDATEVWFKANAAHATVNV